MRSLHVVFLSCRLLSEECLNKPNLLQQKLGKFVWNILMSFRQLLPARLAMQPLRRVSQCDKKFFVENHQKSKHHQGKLETKSKFQSKQIVLQLDQVNFKEQVVSSFLDTDIPLYKLSYPSSKSLYATVGKVLLLETALRACVAKLVSK